MALLYVFFISMGFDTNAPLVNPLQSLKLVTTGYSGKEARYVRTNRLQLCGHSTEVPSKCLRDFVRNCNVVSGVRSVAQSESGLATLQGLLNAC